MIMNLLFVFIIIMFYILYKKYKKFIDEHYNERNNINKYTYPKKYSRDKFGENLIPIHISPII